MFFIFIFILALPFIIRLIKSVFFWDIPTGLVLFLGTPGAGKTSLCAYFSKVFHKRKKYKGLNIYCNVPIIGTLQYTPNEHMGIYDISDGVVLCDESGIVFNNRKFKSLPNTIIEFAKLYRHYGISSFLMFSQGLDIDITFVRLSNKICLVYKSFLPYFICVKEVQKYIGIDDMTKQLVDNYQYKKPFGTHLIFAPSCWKLFDTYECPALPKKQYIEWANKSRYNQGAE